METLSFEDTQKLLLTKGVCGHSHIEGGHVTSDIFELLQEVGDLYKQKPILAKRFRNLTGRSYEEIIQWSKKFHEEAKRKQKMDFERDFLSSLFVAKLGEASSPELIYKLTQIQLKQELDIHSGISLEITPLVWIEMGLEWEKCVNSFVSAVEDFFANYTIRGPIKIGVNVKRFHIVERHVSDKSAFLSEIKYPYLKPVELMQALHDASLPSQIEIFGDIVDFASRYPLFPTQSVPNKGFHVKKYLQAVKNTGSRVFLHLLEQLPEPEILQNLKNKEGGVANVSEGIQKAQIDEKAKIYELEFIVNTLQELDIKNGRLIHMAYWPQGLPYKEMLVQNDFEIAICQTSTRKLGASHTPRSPFLLKNPDLIEKLVYDNNFVRLILGTDDAGPLGIKDIWEEMVTVKKDIQSWHGKKLGNLSFIIFLRNAYKEDTPSQISRKYGLDKRFVEWFLAYDLFENKEELQNAKIAAKVTKRVKAIIRTHKKILEA